MIRAYDEQYLSDAMHNLGEAFDFARNVCQIELDTFLSMMISSGVAALFESGTPKYVSGMSGTELGQRLFREIRPDEEPPAPVISTVGRSPEYWGGWALAHFHWYWCKTFRWIFARTSMSNLLGKYSVYHEMDVSRFLEDFMQELESVKVEKNLRRIRLAAGYSQSELSRLSGVNIRNIQLYEQGVQDINRASASTLASLARPLACTIEDLME